MKSRKMRTTADAAEMKASRRRAGRRGGRPRKKTVKAWDWTFAAPPKSNLQGKKIRDFYRPLKKPVTLRLDADVLAWFQKDGKRYQTRINAALRKVMETELKKG